MKSQTLRANLHTMVKHTYEISTKFFNYLGDNKEIKFKKMSADAERKIEEENKMYEIKSWHLKILSQVCILGKKIKFLVEVLDHI